MNRDHDQITVRQLREIKKRQQSGQARQHGTDKRMLKFGGDTIRHRRGAVYELAYRSA
jgi:hypothetical protein